MLPTKEATLTVEVHEWRNRDGSWPRKGSRRVTSVFATCDQNGDCILIDGPSPLPGEHRLLVQFNVAASEIDRMRDLLPKVTT